MSGGGGRKPEVSWDCNGDADLIKSPYAMKSSSCNTSASVPLAPSALKFAAGAVFILSVPWPANGAIVGQWIADNYTSGDWTDSSGGNHTATLLGTVTTSTTGFNGHKSIVFPGGDGAGASGFFTVANDATLLVDATSFTLAAVFNPATANTSVGGQFWQKAGLIGNEQPNAVTDWGLGFAASQAYVGVGAPDTTILSNTVSLMTPHVVVATWSTSGTMTLYVDGVQVNQTTTAPTAPRSTVGFPIALGADVGVQNNDLHIFNGQVAELRIYNDATTDPAAIYNGLRNTYLVPEPGTSAILVTALVGLVSRRRR